MIENSDPGAGSGGHRPIYTVALQGWSALLANGAAVIVLPSLSRLTLSPEVSNSLGKLIFGDPLVSFLVNVVPFPLVLLCLSVYYFRPGKALLGRQWNAQILRILFNAPLVASVLAMVGWLFAFSVTVAVQIGAGLIDATAMLENGLFIAVLAAICFVLTYYLVDAVNRFYLFRFAAPGLDPFAIPGVFALSVQTRLFIFFAAVCVTPALVFLRIMGAGGLDPELQLQAHWTALGVLIFGVMMTLQKSYSIRNPLRAMQQTAVRIREADFESRVRIEATDELGFLSESLNQMAASLADREKLRAAFDRAVDPSVRERLMSSDSPGEIREVTALFADIAGFTAHSESRSPESVVALLNRIFELIAAAVAAEGGHINKYIGDAAFAVFNAPAELPDHAGAAIRAAMRVRAAIQYLNAELAGEGLPPVRLRIGVHSGSALAGLVGATQRMEYTVIGDAVNTASRLEAACKTLGTDLLVSADTVRLAQTNDGLQFAGKLQLRGKERPVGAWRPASP